MASKFNIILYFFSFLLLVTCTKEDDILREYPRLKTLPVVDISEEGATFSAQILELGNQDIVEYGFVWGESENLTIEQSERKVVSSKPDNLNFDSRISTTLKDGNEYFVLSYIKTPNYIVYGQAVSFTSLGSLAPIINDFNPKYGSVGDTIIITGNNFSYIYNTNKVKLNNINAKSIYSNDSLIHFVVPDSINTVKSEISVQIVGNKSVAKEPFELLSPIISSIYPEKVKSGDTLNITGKYFAEKSEFVEVHFGKLEATITERSNQLIQVIVPNKLDETNSLTLTVGPNATIFNFVYLKPNILSYNPLSITWRDTVSIEVENFYEEKNRQSIKLNSLKVDLFFSSDSLVKFIIPDELVAINNTLNIEIAGYNLSNDELLSLKTPEISSIPDTIAFGESITMKGRFFHPTINKFDISGRPINSEVTVMNSEYDFSLIIPQSDYYYEDENNRVNLSILVNGGTFRVSTPIVLKTPIINSFTPSTITDLDQIVTITGNNFEGNPIVTIKDAVFNYVGGKSNYAGDIQLEVISASKHKLEVKLPNSDEFLTYPGFAQSLIGRIQIQNFQRRSISENNMEYQHEAPWNFNSDGGLFDIDGGLFDLRVNYQLIQDNNFGYLIGGRGEYIYDPVRNNIYQKRLNDFHKYLPGENRWSKKTNFPRANSLDEVKIAYYFNNQIYIITKENIFSTFINDSWEIINSNLTNDYTRYFSVADNSFVFNNTGFLEYNPETGESGLFLDAPFAWQSIGSSYEYAGNYYFRITTGEEYVFNPTLMSLVYLRDIDPSLKVIEHNGNYFSYSSTEINLYDPATDAHSFAEEFPLYNQNETSNFFFSLNDRLYFRKGVKTLISFDTTF